MKLLHCQEQIRQVIFRNQFQKQLDFLYQLGGDYEYIIVLVITMNIVFNFAYSLGNNV